MSWALEPFELTENDLTVRAMRPSDVEAFAPAIVDPEGWTGRTWGARDPEGARRFLRGRLESQARGEGLSLVCLLGGRPAGVTGFHSVIERRRVIEIGFTTVTPSLRRTSLNTRVKALLLRHAFGALGAVRVEFRVDAKNYVSQCAMLRLGARFDGRIDHWVVREGDPHPVGHIYSVTVDRWPPVRERLEALLERRPVTEGALPSLVQGSRLRLEQSKLADAPEFLALAGKDPATIEENFRQLWAVKCLDQAKAYIAQRAHWAAEGTGFHYLLRDQTYSTLLGHLQVKSLNPELASCELGYLLAPEHRGKGYGTEMLALAMRILRARGISRITVRVLPTNGASLALARKGGFREEGMLRNEHLTARGERRDVMLLSAL